MTLSFREQVNSLQLDVRIDQFALDIPVYISRIALPYEDELLWLIPSDLASYNEQTL